jgi:hypothetical protein
VFFCVLFGRDALIIEGMRVRCGLDVVREKAEVGAVTDGERKTW